MQHTQRCATAYTPPLDAEPPPAMLAHQRSLDDLESQKLDESLDALDVLGISAPVLRLEVQKAERALATSGCNGAKSKKSSPKSKKSSPKSRKTRHAERTTSPRTTAQHKHVRRASKKQVHELQTMVDEMQLQVNGAAAEVQQLAQLVGQFAQQREQQQREQEQLQRERQEAQWHLPQQQEQQQLFQQRTIEMEMAMEHQPLQTQIQPGRGPFESERRLHEMQLQMQQQCLVSPPTAVELEPFMYQAIAPFPVFSPSSSNPGIDISP